MNLVRQLRFESPPHLPPPSAAPILEYYDPDLKRIADDHQLSSPVDDQGVVDIYTTVEQALALVDPEYVWPREEPKPDIHHFVWERSKYHPDMWGESKIPRDYRDIPFLKGYLPRQLHHFIHAAMVPPPVPDFEVMREKVNAYKSAQLLFQAARRTIVFDRRPDKFKGVDRADDGEILLEQEILNVIFQRMHDEFVRRKTAFLDDGEFVTELDLSHQPLEIIARNLGRIAAHNGVNLFPKIYANRRAA